MLISYIQSIMMIILEVICCKIFFESFAEKRSKNNYRNYSIILGIVVCEYVIAPLFYDKFILKQILAIVAVLRLLLLLDALNKFNQTIQFILRVVFNFYFTFLVITLMNFYFRSEDSFHLICQVSINGR